MNPNVSLLKTSDECFRCLVLASLKALIVTDASPHDALCSVYFTPFYRWFQQKCNAKMDFKNYNTHFLLAFLSTVNRHSIEKKTYTFS